LTPKSKIPVELLSPENEDETAALAEEVGEDNETD